MTELTREQIENFLGEGAAWCPSNSLTKAMARMALAKKDAEQRADELDRLFNAAMQSKRDSEQRAQTEREATDEWATRAQRAEAECERLRDALRYVSEMFSGGYGSVEDRAEAMNQIAEQALATPPPESDQDRDEIENGQHPEPIEYEQTHGDALAALDNQLMEAVMALNDSGYSSLADSVQEARRHLTASGVPYVPESIRDLPEKMRREANYVEPDRFRPADSYSMGVDDMANMLEAALAATLNDGGGA